ncbi:hypothetical protein CBL_20632 [Carabus blaptoides fortunei]
MTNTTSRTAGAMSADRRSIDSAQSTSTAGTLGSALVLAVKSSYDFMFFLDLFIGIILIVRIPKRILEKFGCQLGSNERPHVDITIMNEISPPIIAQSVKPLWNPFQYYSQERIMSQ